MTWKISNIGIVTVNSFHPEILWLVQIFKYANRRADFNGNDAAIEHVHHILSLSFPQAAPSELKAYLG